MMNRAIGTLMFILLLVVGQTCYSQDSNFHIYLCFGQSNMEGNAGIEAQDTIALDKRFKVMEAVDCPVLGREMGKWYTAFPPFVSL